MKHKQMISAFTLKFKQRFSRLRPFYWWLRWIDEDSFPSWPTDMPTNTLRARKSHNDLVGIQLILPELSSLLMWIRARWKQIG